MQSPLHHHRRRRASRAPIERAVGASIERLERRLVLSALTIAQENALPGTPQSQWDVSGIGDPTLQGFATDISTNVGGTVKFKINDTTGASYHVDIYRMGYYQGNGARLVTSIPTSLTTETVQPAPITDSNTGLVDCGNWSVSASWTVPTDATSGIYFARLVRDDTGGASHVVFVVRNDASHSDLLFQTSDSTWEAYNTYGGNSLYQGNSTVAPGRAVKVSYNRPFNDRATTGGLGSNSWVFYSEYPMVRFLEKNGYDVSYFTDVDSDRNGALIKNHKAFLSVGHDEYWSGAQRANVEAARNAGVNLDFFSGDEATWKTRWENSVDGSGTAYRTLVCYKETHADKVIDPLDPTTWTGTWRDPRFSPPADGGLPENALSGTIFMVDRGPNDVGTPMTVPAADASMRIWRNSAVAQLTGSQTISLGTAILGYEWDVDADNGFRPAGLIDLSSTTQNVNELIQDYGTDTAPGVATHSITFYKAASGARVVSVGTVQWSWGLDSFHDGTSGAVDANVQQATVNIFADDGIQPATLQGGLIAGSPSTDVSAPTSHVTSPSGGTVNSGVPVTITGTALDTGGGVVGGVEVSTDGGVTWHPATGHGNWSYSWIPGALGTVKILTRATDDSGNIEAPNAGVTVTVNPPIAPLSVFNPSATPALASASDTGAIELGVRIRSDISGYITGIRFYKGPGNTGTHVGSLWSNAGTLLARATFTSETGSGWQQVNFASPVAVTAGTMYVASYYAPNGGYSYDDGYFATHNADNGPLHALPDTAAGRNGLYSYGGAPTFPAQTYQSANYWVDVVFTNSLVDTTPPVVTGETPAPSGTGVDPSGALTATFSESIKPATLSFVLTGPGGATVPATVTYDDSTHKATLAPSSPLAANTTYTATVSGAQDLSGNVMAAPITWSFTTGAPVSGTFSLWPSATPTNASASDGSSVELGLKFRSDVNGFITGVRFYKGSGNTGAHVGNLWSSTGQLLGTANFSGETVSGWQTVTFAAPVAVIANTVYVASYYAPTGHYAYDPAYFASTGTDNGPLHALANGVSGGDGLYGYGSKSLFPTNSFNSTNYWVDVVFAATIADTTPPTVTAQSPAPGAIGVATNAAVTATFSEAVQSGFTFTLKDSGGNAVPATLTYNATTNVATLTPASVLVGGATYTATVSGAKDSAGNVMTGPVTWSFTTAVPDTTPPTVTAQSPAAGATNVSTGAAVTATFSESVQAATISFTLKTSGGQTVAGTVAYNDTTHTATFSPSAPLAGSATYTATVSGAKDLAGNAMTSAVSWSFTTAAADTTPPTVTAQSPAGGATNVSASTAVTATFSESVQASTISFTLKDAAGHPVVGTLAYSDTTHTATFTPSALLAGSTAYTATVTGAQDLAGNAMTAPVSWSFTTAAPSSYSLWATPTPANTSANDSSGVELGVKFRTDTAGFITGLRFYKGTGNGGAHIGNVWSSTGQLLGTATFSGETASGWQTVTFALPIAVAANTVYVASYYAPQGHYAYDPAYFATAGVDNGPLHALANGVSGADGVFGYGASSTFPSSSFNSTNYWVDVVFATSVAAPGNSWKQTTTGDFGAGTTSGTTVTNAAGGEIALSQGTETFSGTALPSGWTSTSWAPAGGGPASVTVAGGILSVAGAEVQSQSFATATPVEAMLSFGATPYQHFGLATDVSSFGGNNWAMFSTMGTTNTLYARVNANGATQDVSLGALPTGIHKYRIQPIAGAFEFFVDGVLQTTLSAGFASGSPLKVTMSAFAGSPSPAMQLDSLTYGNYASPGAFTSSVFDAGATVKWGTVSWTAALPANTSILVEVRSGNTAAPDGTWSGWTALANGGAIGVPNSRYLQYRVTFTTTDPLQTPSLSDILFTWT